MLFTSLKSTPLVGLADGENQPDADPLPEALLLDLVVRSDPGLLEVAPAVLRGVGGQPERLPDLPPGVVALDHAERDLIAPGTGSGDIRPPRLGDADVTVLRERSELVGSLHRE